MSEAEQEIQASQGISLPIDLHVPDTIHSQYIHNVIVQPGQYEITLFFLEAHVPPLIGSPEENREYLMQKGSIRFECVSKLVVAPQLVPDIIQALQVGLDNYKASNTNE